MIIRYRTYDAMIDAIARLLKIIRIKKIEDNFFLISKEVKQMYNPAIPNIVKKSEG